MSTKKEIFFKHEQCGYRKNLWGRIDFRETFFFALFGIGRAARLERGKCKADWLGRKAICANKYYCKAFSLLFGAFFGKF